MLTTSCDPADTANASEFIHPVESVEPITAANLCDFIEDCITIEQPSLLNNHPQLRMALRNAFKQAHAEGWQQGGNEESHEFVVRLCDFMAEKRFPCNLLAHSIKIALNRSTYSEVEIARALGVTRASVSKIKILIQDHFNLKPRIGRSAEARAKFSEGRKCKTKPKQARAWKSLDTWTTHLGMNSKLNT